MAKSTKRITIGAAERNSVTMTGVFRDYSSVVIKMPGNKIIRDVAKAFDTVRVFGILYKLMLLNFPSYITYTNSSHLRGRTMEASFQTATSPRRDMWAG